MLNKANLCVWAPVPFVGFVAPVRFPLRSRCFPLRFRVKQCESMRRTPRVAVGRAGAVRPACCAVNLCKSLLINAKSLLIDCKSFLVASRCFSLLPAAFPLRSRCVQAEVLFPRFLLGEYCAGVASLTATVTILFLIVLWLRPVDPSPSRTLPCFWVPCLACSAKLC